MLKHQKRRVRELALRTLARLGDKTAASMIVPLLEDPSNEVRGAAAWALGNLPATTEAGRIIPLLGDPESRIRQSAARACGKLNTKAAIPNLVRMLHDVDPDVCHAAAEALGRMNTPEVLPHLERFLCRQERAAPIICRAGSASGAHVVIEDLQRWETNMFCLNRLRNRELWIKLRSREFFRMPGESVDVGFRRALEEAGLILDAPVDFQLSDESWVDFFGAGRYGFGPRVTLVEALDVELLSNDINTSNDAVWCGILEGGQLRVLRSPEAREFWREWWRNYSRQ